MMDHCCKRNRALVALALLVATLVTSAAQARASAAGPELVIDKERHDFGEVFAGEELSCVFNVRNAGTSPLELSSQPLAPRKASALDKRPLMGMISPGFLPSRAAARRAAPT